jgi:hypothetical protein
MGSREPELTPETQTLSHLVSLLKSGANTHDNARGVRVCQFGGGHLRRID